MIGEKILISTITGFLGGMMCFFVAFAVAKKLSKKRTLSYLISGITSVLILCPLLFEKDLSKIVLILCMILDIICTLVFYIGEKRALKSGRHCGDVEKDRGARKFKLAMSLKEVFKKFPYPFLKDKGILNNLEYVPKYNFINTNSREYRSEVAQRKAVGHIFHWFFILMWYSLVLSIWASYFIVYGVYWMFVATIDTFKELYTHEGSKFSFQSAVSEIANSEELADGINTIKKSVKSATSMAENTISEVGKKASSAIAEHKNKSSNAENAIKQPIDSAIFEEENVISEHTGEPSSDENTIKQTFEPEISEEENIISEHTVEPSDDENTIKQTFEPETFEAENIISEHQSKPSSDTKTIKKLVKPATSTAEHTKIKLNKAIALDKQTENINTAKHLPDNEEPQQEYMMPQKYVAVTAPPRKKNYVLPVLITTLIIILVLIIGILAGMIFSMKSNDNDNIGTPDNVFSVANLAEAPEEEENSQPPVITTTAPKSSGNVKKENTSAYVAGKKENESASSSAYANAYIEFRETMGKSSDSGMTIWHKTGTTYLYLRVTGNFSYYKYEYYYEDYSDHTTELKKSDTTSASEIYLTGGTGGFVCTVYVTPYDADGNAGKTVTCNSSENAKITLESFVIEVINSHLHYYSGAGYDYESSEDFLKAGTYTIVEVDDYGEWGKLKSGAGWINLNDASYESPLSAKSWIIEEQEKTFEPYIIKIENPYLPYYSGAGYNYTVNGAITDKSKYTIVEESGDWGKLKSGAGWINLIDAKNSSSSSGGQSSTFEPYIIKIETPYLPYYSGAGYNYTVNGAITDQGKYTIVEESGDWGKLKSGAGWINLIEAKGTSAGGVAYDGLGSYEEEAEYSNSVTVYSCNYYGQISTSGGATNGYSTSYIVDGGAMSKVRTDLMNNWHVTAVNYCTSNGTTWYELYDTDDGDYYGWVDSGHINFY